MNGVKSEINTTAEYETGLYIGVEYDNVTGYISKMLKVDSENFTDKAVDNDGDSLDAFYLTVAEKHSIFFEGAILGIACIIPKDLYVCLGQRMMLLRTNEKMLGRFLMHYLNSPKVTSFVSTKIGGSASPHVNVGDIKEFIVPIPSVAEQQKMLEQIESRLSVCDSIEKTVDTALQQAEAMRQSILKKAFER